MKFKKVDKFIPSLHPQIRGFSVAEAMITLLIVSVAISAAAPIITRRTRNIGDNTTYSKWFDAMGDSNITRDIKEIYGRTFLISHIITVKEDYFLIKMLANFIVKDAVTIHHIYNNKKGEKDKVYYSFTILSDDGIGTVFNWAIENGYIMFNPVQRVKKLKVNNVEMNFLNEDEINAVLIYAKEKYPKFYPLLLTAIYSGMRRGEILGLTWDCINFKKKTIKVNKTLYKGKLSTPKTKYSIREIKVPQKLIDTLKEFKTKAIPNELNLVFTQSNGKYIDADNMIKRQFNKVLEGTGVSKIRFHDLRHTYASLLLAKDLNIKYIQKQMGHSSFEVTMNTYAHLMPEVYTTSEMKINELF